MRETRGTGCPSFPQSADLSDSPPSLRAPRVRSAIIRRESRREHQTENETQPLASKAGFWNLVHLHFQIVFLVQMSFQTRCDESLCELPPLTVQRTVLQWCAHTLTHIQPGHNATFLACRRLRRSILPVAAAAFFDLTNKG